MKWKKNKILVSLLCISPSLLLVTATLLIVPRVAKQKESIQNPTESIIDAESRTESMFDTIESLSSEMFQENTIWTDQSEYQEETEDITRATKISQPVETVTSEGTIENSQTIDPTDLTTPEQTESSAMPENATQSDNVISTKASEENSQTIESMKSTETIENSSPEASTNVVEGIEQGQPIKTA